MSMLKQRLFTSLVLIPPVLLAIYGLPAGWFGLACLILILVAALEWSRLIGNRHRWEHGLFLILVLLTMFLSTALWMLDVYWIMALGFWGLMLVAIVGYPHSQRRWSAPLALWIIGMILLALAWSALIEIRFHTLGREFILYLLLLVWAADIGAYVTGKLYGKHKLIPQVSPGKTIEGAIGGMLASLVIAVIAKSWIFSSLGWLSWLMLAVLISVVSIVGDLLISMIKRQAGVKDSGRLLPGHGGLLDRIDSLLAAAPIFVLGYGFFQP
ncbi:MAG: CDP-archaeol synthase [Legionellales bacterium]|nr:CDP-archaeol synthase [Legionellales bacterium]